MVKHGSVVSQFLKSQCIFTRGVCVCVCVSVSVVCVCVCVKSFLYLRIGFVCQEISL